MTIHFQSIDSAVGAMTDHLTEEEENAPLSGHIKSMLEGYFNDLDGHPPADLYQMVLQEIEQPLLESVLHYTRGNQSKAAVVLGLNRGTLRKKLKQYDLN